MAAAPRVLFALTSHGLGHLTRSLAVARALRARSPAVELLVATTHPRARVALDLPEPIEWHAVDYEPGTLPRSCFETDLEATRAAYLRFDAARDARRAEERSFLRAARCDALVCDVPALAVAAAAELGLAAIGLANFTWDWLLEPITAGTPAEAARLRIAEDYARGSLHLRLPFGPEESPFPRSEPAPLVCRRARLAPAALRARLGLPEREERRLVVVCPGGWSPDAWSEIHVSGCDGFRFVTVGDLPVRADAPLLALPHALCEGVTLPDLVAAADLVLAKPGYGIASECAAHRTPLVAIERPDFRETPVLLAGFRALGPCTALSLRDFFAGRWEGALRAGLADVTPFAPLPEDGAARVAQRIGEALGLEAGAAHTR
jgi:L-arabinokinase